MSLRNLAIEAYKNQTSIIEKNIILELELEGVFIFKIISSDYKFKEIFVYSKDFEAIHIRSGDIARGGIRISNRSDYRKEAIDLVLAQIPKNSIIIPTGSKGCIFLKTNISPEDAYKKFVKSIIAITQKTNDRYLVIAADKGTSSYSDIANQISIKENFWLKDAFASGGKDGYDHKEIGITSLGVWQSILVRLEALSMRNREFITMVGVGSMNGDVFGNGVNAYYENIKLLAAISSKEIFIDPNPNITISLEERKRLFKLKNSSWKEYDRSKLSKGGMIIDRSDKEVTLTQEVQKMLSLSSNLILINDLISLLLKHSVDILFMGAVGTYVKASSEKLDFDIDNHNIRVDGKDLNCKIFAEGANLSITHAGRLEASEKGVLVYTDFIDNVAGVFCSDIEINLKILLSDNNDRNDIIESMKSFYVQYILQSSYAQCNALQSAKRLKGWHKLYLKLADNIVLNKFDFSKDLLPDIAYLMSYLKIFLKEKLFQQDLSKYDDYVHEYFPFFVNTNLQSFKYKKNLISTLLASDIVNYLFLNAKSVDEIIDKTSLNYKYDVKFKSFFTKELFLVNFLL